MSSKVIHIDSNMESNTNVRRQKRTRTGRTNRVKKSLPRNINANMNNRDSLVNPININPHDVRTHHFRDARLYDETAENGFIIQNWVARKNFNRWLKTIRGQSGMEMFRRPKKIVFEEFDSDNGTRVRLRTTIQKDTVVGTIRTILNRPGNNKRVLLPGQAKDNADGIDNYVPKMFTVTMGREVSVLRNSVGLTQAKLARVLNVTENHIKRVELGGLVTFNPEDEFVKKLAAVLEVPSIKYQD